MARILEKGHLPCLEGVLGQQLPGSVKVYGLVRAISEGTLDLEIWVDTWPQFTAVVIKPGDITTVPEYIRNVYTVYQTPEADGSGCAALLRHPTVIDWKSNRIFGGITNAVRRVIEAEVAAFCCTQELKVADVCLLMQATKETLTNIEGVHGTLPDGIKESTLTPDDAALVTSRWSQAGPGAEGFIRFLITNFKSVALRDPSDTPIGWFIVQHYGALGMLYIEPEHRRKGLGKYLVQRLAKIVIDQGMLAFVVVENDNESSKRLHLKCGFCHLPGEDVQWILSKPKCNPSAKFATCCV